MIKFVQVALLSCAKSTLLKALSLPVLMETHNSSIALQGEQRLFFDPKQDTL